MTDDGWSPWIPHGGGECPIPWAEAGQYKVKFADDEVGGRFAAALDFARGDDLWRHGGPWGTNIVAYRYLLSAAPPGWTPPGSPDTAPRDDLAKMQPRPIEAPLQVRYRNWRGEVSVRTLLPKAVWYGSTEWHPEPGWLLKAVDVAKGVERDFAMSGVLGPAVDEPPATTSVIEEIAAERRRQIEVEGWTAEHDDRWNDTRQLARAAASYAGHAGNSDRRREDMELPLSWPWPPHSWKPKDRRRDLIRAAALIIAAVEQMDRQEAKEKTDDR